MLAWPLVAFLSCGERNTAAPQSQIPLPTEKEICDYYNLYLQGDYLAFVAAMHSCDQKTSAYRMQMAELLKQHARMAEEKYGGVKSAKVQRIDSVKNGCMVNAFLVVEYGDGRNEEILFPLVFVDGKWRLQ